MQVDNSFMLTFVIYGWKFHKVSSTLLSQKSIVNSVGCGKHIHNWLFILQGKANFDSIIYIFKVNWFLLKSLYLYKCRSNRQSDIDTA